MKDFSKGVVAVLAAIMLGGSSLCAQNLPARSDLSLLRTERNLIRQAVVAFETRLSMRDTVSLTGQLESDQRKVITVDNREVAVGPRAIKREFVTSESRVSSVETAQALRTQLAGIYAQVPEYVRVRFDPDSIAVEGNAAQVDVRFYFQGVETPQSRALVSRSPERISIQLAKHEEDWVVSNFQEIATFLSSVTASVSSTRR